MNLNITPPQTCAFPLHPARRSCGFTLVELNSLDIRGLCTIH